MQGSWMPSTLPYREFQQTTLMCFEHMAADPSAQTAGIVFLVDYQDFTPEKVFYYSIGLIRRAIEFLQIDCFLRRSGGPDQLGCYYPPQSGLGKVTGSFPTTGSRRGLREQGSSR
ncbi:hypothetical protein HPB47_023982 [Ixodes persulcatus]|uniref:Uncharacterized protein n=1 Tax=Ixodes persulcatus TaxID=34615 RepID=A0AC60Q5I0_IXOPE|nr:hypothetical protein HPB47_023982 [Ixodes persulcatus]